ncbi:MAG: hypothetical protein WCW31_01920 [Patescibacteria group bacterium]|jgi:hypothetical protein
MIPQTPAKLEKLEVSHTEFRDFFATQGLFCEQIIALSVDPATMSIAVAFSRQLPANEVRGELQAAARGFEIISFTPFVGLTLIETSTPVPYASDIYPEADELCQALWQTLPLAKNAGLKANQPFYLAGNVNMLCCQYYLTDTGRLFPIYAQAGKEGITSIRYNCTTDQLIGIRVDQRGFGVAIAQFPASVAMRKPHKLSDFDYWKDIESPAKPILHSFSKPSRNGDMILNYQTGILDSLFFTDSKRPPQHSPTITSRSRVVGTLAPGSGTYLEYQPVTGHTQVRNVKLCVSTPQVLCDLVR